MAHVYPDPAADPAPPPAAPPAPAPPAKRKKKHRRRFWLTLALVLGLLLLAARVAMEPAVLWYVNRTLDRDPLYDGQVDDISISLWRGAYTVYGITIQKKAGGSTAKPLLTLDRLDLAVQWNALLNGKIVAEIDMLRPVVSFVDAGNASESQTGAGGPWLGILQDLFPFTINRVTVRDGRVHFYSERGEAPVDVYLSDVQATVTDLTNVRNRITPLVTTVRVDALAMDQAPVELDVKLDPSSYRPTFEMAMRMLNFDVTRINALAQAYGGLDFAGGWFDLTVEAEARNGLIDGTVKPLFRNLEVFNFTQDVVNGTPLQAIWELLLGVTGELLENQPRDQLGTQVDFTSDSQSVDYNLLEVIGNVLRNAFIQAYLPQLRGEAGSDFTFSPASITRSP